MEQEKPTKPETDRTFPEDDDTLYREMTVHMPRCYFPTSLGENSILKFAGEEFRRVKNIVCRRYNFNEDKYIRENAGVSPFDSVRGNFEQEVYRRLRKDYAHLSIISIRRSLMEKIRDAVKKENNIIGTFYRNCGVHYREAESAEYETSPIVVVHNSAFYGYGGYESATVYELFIDGNGKLLCTLNGEAGEDFDEPIGQVQTEGLLEIAHWLEEHGFISADVNDDEIVVCEGCGSDNIQTQAWVDPNARTFIGTTGIDRYDNWCDECEDHQPFCTLKEFKERMEEWWNSLDANQMEQITGCRQDKCPAGDNHQGFAETCNEWWENKRVPAFRIVFQFAQLFLHLPRVGERPDVHASRGRSRSPETVFVAQRYPQRAVTAHTQARDGAALARRNRQVAGVDPVGQFLRHEGLELRRRIEGTVPIPTVRAVGADDDHPAGVGQRTQVGDVLPRRVRTAETMQQVEHGHAPPDAGIGNHDQRRNFALHLRAENRHRVDLRSGGSRRGKSEKQNQKALSHNCLNLSQKRARTTRTP